MAIPKKSYTQPITTEPDPMLDELFVADDSKESYIQPVQEPVQEPDPTLNELFVVDDPKAVPVQEPVQQAEPVDNATYIQNLVDTTPQDLTTDASASWQYSPQSYQGGATYSSSSGQTSSYAPSVHYEEQQNNANRAQGQFEHFFGSDYIDNTTSDINKAASNSVLENNDPENWLGSSFTQDRYAVTNSQEYQTDRENYTAYLKALGVNDDKINEQVDQQLANKYDLPQAFRESEHVWYQLEDGQYTKHDTTPIPMDEQVKQFAAIGVVLATPWLVGQIAPALSAGLGVSTAAGQGIGAAIVSGTSTAIQGGDVKDILKSAALSGVAGYANGLAGSLEEANAAFDLAKASGDYAAMADAMTTLTGLEGTLSAISNVNNGLKFANAVDNGADPLKAAASIYGKEIAGFIDVDDTLNAGLKNIFNDNVADALTNDGAFTGLLIDQVAGRNLGDALADRYGSQVAEQLFSDTKNGQAFGLGAIDAIAEYGENGDAPRALFDGIRRYAEEGGDLKDVKSFLSNLVPELGDLGSGTDFGWIEDGLKELGRDFDDNALQPIKDFLVGLVPEGIDGPDLGFIEDGLRDAGRAVDDNVLQPIKDTTAEVVRETGRAIDENVIQPAGEAASTVNREVIRPVLNATEEAASDAAAAAREAGRVVDDEVLQPIKDTTADVVRETGRTIRDAIPDVDLNFEGPDLNFEGPDIDLPDIGLPDVGLPSLDPSSLLSMLQGQQGGPGQVDVESGDLVDLGEIFDFDNYTLEEYLAMLSGKDNENEDRRKYNQGGIVKQNDLDELISLLRGN